MSTTSAREVLVPICLAALLALPGAAGAQSQAAGGAIEGTVTDESGSVLPGAAVTVKNQATGVVRETTTNGAGVYRAHRRACRRRAGGAMWPRHRPSRRR